MAWSYYAVPAWPTKPATVSKAREARLPDERFKIAVLTFVPPLAGTLIVLRITGLDPGHPSFEEYAEGTLGTTGTGLTGERVREPVTHWDWVNQFDGPRRKCHGMETRTWYGIPHSVRVLLVPRGEALYLQSSAQTFRLNRDFPHGKAWWAHVERDPRVRLKIDGKLYDMTAVLVQDRDEVARLRGGASPIVKTVDAEGNEQITEEWHYWRLFQRNVPEYGGGGSGHSEDNS